jgi:hypothetical protein
LGEEKDDDDLDDEDGDRLGSVMVLEGVTHVGSVIFGWIETGNDAFVDPRSLCE